MKTSCIDWSSCLFCRAEEETGSAAAEARDEDSDNDDANVDDFVVESGEESEDEGPDEEELEVQTPLIRARDVSKRHASALFTFSVLKRNRKRKCNHRSLAGFLKKLEKRSKFDYVT